MNIIETVQKNLGYNSLEKIDPNTQETPGRRQELGTNALAQAAIPSVLLGIYNMLEQTPEPGLLNPDKTGSQMNMIFGKSAEEVIKRINAYSKVADKHSLQELEHITSESMRVIKTKIGENASESAIRNFVAKNKPDTLLYLPPALELGSMLRNNNLDDRTGKIEGPVSSLMHSVEKTFNNSAS